MGKISFERPDGTSCDGYLARAGDGRPGVVVIQEWWGLNAQIKSVADRLKDAGYNALVPDLFHGRVAGDANEASHLMDGLDFQTATFEDIRGAIRSLQKNSGKIAVLGFCMGGALAVAAAVHLPEVAASICFYGIPPSEFADPAKVSIPFQGHFASRDKWITPEKVDALEAAMKAAGNAPEIHRNEADHAFFNQMRPEVHDPENSRISWERSLAFLARNL